MRMPARRFGWPRQLAMILLVTMLIGASVMVGFGMYRSVVGDRDGLWLIVSGAITMALGLFLFLQVLVSLKQEANTHRIHDVLLDLVETATWMRGPVLSIAEDVKISDAARSLAHREQECAALRSAIEDEIRKANWELASKLVTQMEQRFGYGEEAARLREEIAETHQMAIETKIDEAIARIDELTEAADWAKARSESQRLVRLFPNDERVRELPGRIEQRRERHKRELLIEWEEVAARKEVDRAIQLLHELDEYLSPQEAEELRESARVVLKDQLLNLGLQFRLAVADRRWKDALEAGLQIIEERPNSKMASEVRAMLIKLQQRAGLTTEAVVIDQRPRRADA